MPLAFPLSLTALLDALPVASCSLDLGEALQTDETGGGEALFTRLGARLWTGRYAMTPMSYAEANDAQALIDLVRDEGASFPATDLQQRGPRADPTGARLAGYTPTLTATQTAGREITIASAPPGYVLGRGDMLAFSYGSPATPRALHRVVTGGTASGGGTTGWIEVSPGVRAGIPVSARVTLFRPVCKAVILPGSFEPGECRDRLVSGMSFRFVQTLAA